MLVLLTHLFWLCFRYGQFDPYDRPNASLGYNIDDSDFTGPYHQQSRANGHADYYGYGTR